MQHDDQAIDRLSERFGAEAVTGPHTAGDAPGSDPWVTIEAKLVAEAARFLRDDADLRFDYLNDLTVVDYLPSAAKGPATKAMGDERLEVVYQLSSLSRRRRLTMKTTLPRWRDGQAGEPPELASVAGVWATADWHEREAFDLGGVRFVGHPNLTRLLCPEDWEGHPLRKDYQMPLEYHGIRGR